MYPYLQGNVISELMPARHGPGTRPPDLVVWDFGPVHQEAGYYIFDHMDYGGPDCDADSP
jgi:hypothetical protein